MDPMKITVLIAEDDPVMRHILKKALEEISDVEVIGEADNGLEAIRLAKEMVPQVVFLDIAMPEKDGLEAAREICYASPETVIIFATAYENFTHEAFEVYAFDYLIKPFKINRIRKTIERIRTRLTKAEPFKNGPYTPQTETNLKIILVKEEGNKILVNIKDIVFLTREGRSVIIHTIEGKIKTTETMEALEQKLTGNSFFRCHRGFIINLNMVKEIQPWGRKTYKVILTTQKNQSP
ncbi:MAG: LytTR family DNA-binding domain-containing protein [Peptococcaceae bacterium]